MRGLDQRSGALVSYVDLEARVRADHPLRSIRQLTDEALAAMSGSFSALYAARMRRPSIPPKMPAAGPSSASAPLNPLGTAADGAAGVRSVAITQALARVGFR